MDARSSWLYRVMAALLMVSLVFADARNDEEKSVCRISTEDGLLEIRTDPNRSRWRGDGSAELYFYLENRRSKKIIFYHSRVGELFGVLTEGIALKSKNARIIIDENVRLVFEGGGGVTLHILDEPFRLTANQADDLRKSIGKYYEEKAKRP